MPVKQAWLRGGPADGRLQTIECTLDGSAPPYVVLPQTGVYLGPGDQPLPATDHIYQLSDNTEDDGDEVVYQYQGTAASDSALPD